jgi:dTDP-4-amino-4,6-dideoxygalactose transaminase
MSKGSNQSIPVFKPYLGEEEIQAAVESLELGWLGPGSFVKTFEEKIASMLNIDPRTVVAVNTGTSAVHLGLKACGVGLGDEVITPSFNNIADFQSIRALQAEPVFCDIKLGDLTIDVNKIEPLISDKTRAIICLDYGAALCDFYGVKKLADKHGIPVLYDAAHSFGSKRDLEMVGSEADYCAFSFDPVKNITCIDGGSIIVKDLEKAQKLRYMRLLGQKQNQDKLYANSRSWTYDVDDIGYRYHLANLHGAIGLQQLKKIKQIKEKRQNIYRFYTEALSEIEGIVIPPILSEGVLPFIFVIRVLNNKREEFINFMSNAGVDTGIHWQPGHHFSYFESCPKGDLSVTDMIADQIVTIPFYPDLTLEQAKTVADAIKEFFS